MKRLLFSLVMDNLIEGASNEDFFDTYFDYLLEDSKNRLTFADFLETYYTYDIWDNS